MFSTIIPFSRSLYSLNITYSHFLCLVLSRTLLTKIKIFLAINNLVFKCLRGDNKEQVIGNAVW
jgi:hypothetical protein